MRQVQFSHQDAYQLLESLRDKPNFKYLFLWYWLSLEFSACFYFLLKNFLSLLVNAVSEGPIVVMELMGSDCLGKWINIIGMSGSCLTKKNMKITIVSFLVIYFSYLKYYLRCHIWHRSRINEQNKCYCITTKALSKHRCLHWHNMLCY